MSAIRFDIEVGEDGERLDVVVVRRVPAMSRARTRSFCEQGLILINDRPARKGTRVRVGDRIEIRAEPVATDFDPVPEPNLSVEVVYEDSDVVVVSKPARMACHPLRPHERDTLANFLIARYPEMHDIGRASRELGLVNRIDTDTTGIVIASRHADAYRDLRRALQEYRIDKRYLALCQGEVTAPRILDYPLESRGARVAVSRDPKARLAETELLTSRAVGEFSLVKIRTRRGFRHQIRVHLAAIGHPLVGDIRYGGPECALGHHFLHASEALFPSSTGAVIHVTADLPAAHQALLTEPSG